MGNLAIAGYGEFCATYENASVQPRFFEVDGERGKLIEYVAADPAALEVEDDMLCINGVWIHHRGGSQGFRRGIIDGNDRFRSADRLKGRDEDPRLLRQWTLDTTTTESGLVIASPALATES